MSTSKSRTPLDPSGAKVDGRKRRKRIVKVKDPNSPTSEASRRMWQRPEYRAKMAAFYAARRADPEKRWSRRGIFDGMTREESEASWARARESANRTVDKMIEKGILESDDDLAADALRESVTIMRSDSNTVTRLKAARQVLEWTKAKPESKSKVTVQTAEDWLAAIAADSEDSFKDE